MHWLDQALESKSLKCDCWVRLLIEVRECCGASAVSLQTILSPEYFDHLIAAARSLGGYSADSLSTVDRFKDPSTSDECGYALKKAAYLVKGQALRKKDMLKKRNIDLFLELYEAEWSKKVTRHTLENLAFKKHNWTSLKCFLPPITCWF